VPVKLVGRTPSSAPDEPDFQAIDYRLRVIFPQELIPRQVCVCL
jgi:hypothetical protein